jgi:arsenite methyltransferase
MKEIEDDKIRKAVRDDYARLVKSGSAGCGCVPSCCGGTTPAQARDKSTQMGYSEEDVASVPQGADLGLGCGNPQAIAALKPGETVLDLGSAAGFDCFLAARQVGPTGRVIGVDMTPDMVSQARANARNSDYQNVEFRLGEIEHLPIADASVDVILSNCVINLSPDKSAVFQEAFRVLKPGGRLAISDIVATAPLPEALRGELALYTGCISGAATIAENKRMLKGSGFKNIRIQPKEESRQFIRDLTPGYGVENYVVSATIEAVKP